MQPRREFGFPVGGKRRRSPEFPCVSRFRQRRLIAFLATHKFSRTLDMFVAETDVFMCMKHLLDLVQAGSWADAIDYLSRFLPSDRRLGIHGRVLFHFLRVHKAIDDIIAGAPEARSVTAALEQCIIRHPTKSHAITRLRAIFSSLLCSKRFRAVLDLERLRLQATLTVIDLVYKTPELKDHMAPLRGPMEPQKVLPMAFGYASFRPKRHVKKRRGPALASVVAGLYLQKKKKLLSSASSGHSEALSREALIKAKEWLVDLVDESLEAGKQSEEDLPQSAPNKGAPVTFKRLVSESKLFCKAKEWAVYFIDERLEAWPEMNQDYPPSFSCKDGDPVSPVLQTTPESLTGPAENSTITSVRGAGTYNNLIEEYYSGSRKNPRMESSTIGEGLYPKRRRTTLMSQSETGTEDQLAA
uniref:Uncharacterized protein n=1 Tax=Avena sativa TaxID=4498 RepID=A0ACD5UVS6_AVESA